MTSLARIFYGVAAFGALLAFFEILQVHQLAASAPQQAAGAALALAHAVIPYCLARCIDGMK